MSHLFSLLGALLVLAGAFLLYAEAELFDTESLGDRAAEALVDDVGLRVALAPTIVDAIGRAVPGQEPTEAQVAVALEDPRVAAAFSLAVGATAEQVFDGGGGNADLDVSDVAATAIEATGGLDLESLGPSFAAVQSEAIIELAAAGEVLDVLDTVERVGALAIPLLVAGLICLFLAVGLAPGVAVGISRVGVALAYAAALGVVALLAGRAAVSGRYEDELISTAVEAAWNGLAGDLLLWTAIAGGAALVVAVFAGIARD